MVFDFQGIHYIQYTYIYIYILYTLGISLLFVQVEFLFSTMVNHHFSLPFGEYFVLFQPPCANLRLWSLHIIHTHIIHVVDTYTYIFTCLKAWMMKKTMFPKSRDLKFYLRHFGVDLVKALGVLRKAWKITSLKLTDIAPEKSGDSKLEKPTIFKGIC